MQDSDFAPLSRVRQLVIHGCALAALFTSTLASASTVALSISGAPATTVLGWHGYSFTPTAKGPSGYTLRFSISGKPSWANFSATTGHLSGVPVTANVGTSSTVRISVSDGIASASLPAFVLKVIPNVAPTISGTPATSATVGTPYSFTPKASESDGDAISFSVKNKPSWASFSIATGAISGIPVAANVGTYSNIVISVGTGHGSASLAPFSIAVKSSVSGGGTGGTGTAMLSWTAPTTNTNGSALTDLAGYHIYYGNSPSSMNTMIDIGSPGTTHYTVSSLASGTWYFAVNAYTTSGTESVLSNTGSKSIP